MSLLSLLDGSRRRASAIVLESSCLSMKGLPMFGNFTQDRGADAPEKSYLRLASILAVLLIALAAIHSYWNSSRDVQRLELSLFGQWKLPAGGESNFRLLVRDGKSDKVVEGAAVQLSLAGTTVSTSAKSAEDGIAELALNLPEDTPLGTGELKLELSSKLGTGKLSKEVIVEQPFRTLLSTDKPMYQPGQTVHMRLLALSSLDLTPVQDEEASIEVFDSRGNKVFKKVARTSSFGILSADFILADQVNEGSYSIRARVRDSESSREVRVERYTLPSYSIELSTDRKYYRPGETLSGRVKARYTFGKPVSSARLRIVASQFIERFRPFAKLNLELDERGSASFSIDLPKTLVGQQHKGGDALVSLRAEVEDRAGEEQEKSLERVVTNEFLKLSVVPERGRLVPDVENKIYFFTAYADGRPAKSRIRITALDDLLRTDASGVAVWRVRSEGAELSFSVSARDEKGFETEEETYSLGVDKAGAALLLRSDRVKYKSGDRVELSVFGPASESRVFVDFIKASTTLDTRALDMKEGRARTSFQIPQTLSGTLEINAYRILSDGSVAGDRRLIQVSSADELDIQARFDAKTYRPGSQAKLDISVRRSDGRASRCALSLSAVDEAVFALQEMRPGLERAFFTIQEKLLEPRVTIYGWRPDALLACEEGDKARLLSDAAGGDEGGLPAHHGSKSYEQRKREWRMKTRRERAIAFAVVAMLLCIFSFLLYLPSLIYGFYCAFSGSVFMEEADREQRSDVETKLKSIGRRWIAGLVMPLLLTALLSYFAQPLSQAYEKGLGFIVLLLSSAACIVFLYWGVSCFAGSAGASLCSWCRYCTSLLPSSMVLGYLAFLLVLASALWGSGSHLSYPWNNYLIFSFLSTLVFAIFVAAALKVSSMALARRIGCFSVFFLGVIPPFIPVLLLLLTLLVPNFQGGGRRLNQMAPDAEKALLGRVNALPGGSGGAEGSASLKEPTRIRRDFPETLYWNPQLITDDQGNASLELPLADSITTWRLAMSAVSEQGRLGAKDIGIRVFQPFFIDIDAPVALTQNDEVTLPVAVYNYLEQSQRVEIDLVEAPWMKIHGESRRSLRLKPNEVTNVHFLIEAREPGTHPLLLKARGSEMADALERVIRVEPDGQAHELVFNGVLGDEERRVALDVPEEVIDGSLDLFAKIYPGSFSQVVDGLDGLLRMPFGCFEQTSSATYPNILILDYLRENEKAKPDLEMKALSYIKTGYQRLLSFECSNGGFEWFGNDPPNNVLTAYGLMEFSDMDEVFDVDEAVIERSRQFLEEDQNADGSWTLTEGGYRDGAINDKGSGSERPTAYIAWALAESGAEGRVIENALAWLASRISSMDDSYTLALAANAFIAADSPKSSAAIARLLACKCEKGDDLVFWDASGRSAVSSSGLALRIETTALAAYALLRKQREISIAHKALAWLVEHRDSRGAWHSTQATVHALRALLAGSVGGAADVGEDGLGVSISSGGEELEKLLIRPDMGDVFHLVDLRPYLGQGENEFILKASKRANLAYSLVARYYTPHEGEKKASSKDDEKPISIDVEYDSTSLSKDDVLRAKVKILYQGPGDAAMTLVDLGIPPGFELLLDEVKALCEDGPVSRYSLAGSRLILYFNSLPGKLPLQFSFGMRAKFPVKAKTPRSWIYTYYEPETRDETEPVELEIRGKR